MQRRDLSLSQVDGLILYSPWVDVTMTNPDIAPILPRDPMLGVPGLKWAGQVWAGKLATKDPRISPYMAHLTACLPCVFSQAATTLSRPTS